MIDVAKCYRVSEDTKCYKLRCIGVEVKGPCLQSYPEYNLRQPGPGTAGPRPRGAAAAEGGGVKYRLFQVKASDIIPSLR